MIAIPSRLSRMLSSTSPCYLEDAIFNVAMLSSMSPCYLEDTIFNLAIPPRRCYLRRCHTASKMLSSTSPSRLKDAVFDVALLPRRCYLQPRHVEYLARRPYVRFLCCQQYGKSLQCGRSLRLTLSRSLSHLEDAIFNLAIPPRRYCLQRRHAASKILSSISPSDLDVECLLRRPYVRFLC